MRFENTYAEQLADTVTPYTPSGFPDPQLVYLDDQLADSLGLDGLDVQVLSGGRVPDGAKPIAMAYAGHQFGHFAPQLGDGRAFLLGEVLDDAGRRFDLHLKGSGPTPFSRGGDGYATLGPMLREVLVSHGMHHLGIPTTRGLSVVTTGRHVMRDGYLPGAVLTRVASSHLRVGTLEFFAARGMREQVQRLTDYALRRHAPDSTGALGLLQHTARRQGELVARWMLVGFIHGVMNTDNTTLSGETIDYGPCAFMDTYDPATVFSSIDHAGRYAYGNQPRIMQWNLARMAEALLPDIDSEAERAVELANEALELYRATYDATFAAGMRRKLGLSGEQDDDENLFDAVHAFMHAEKRDFTGFYRRLAAAAREDRVGDVLPGELGERWLKRAGGSPDVDTMDAVNPVYIPRNHKVEEALAAAVDGDLKPFEQLMDVLSRPFEPRLEWIAYAHPAPEEFGPYRTYCGT